MISFTGPLAAQLKTAGLRVTTARLTILAALGALTRPVSHDELAHQQMDHANMDKITIYRTLVAFTRTKLVVRSLGEDRIWRYVLAAQAQRHQTAHPHFNCRDCGDTRCLQDRDVSLHGQAQALSHNPAFEVVLRGRCDNCAPSLP
jgi:Fur family ferric uptake transcriptional regulator